MMGSVELNLEFHFKSQFNKARWMSRELLAVLVDDDVNRATNFRDVWSNILADVYPKVHVAVVNDIEATDDILKGRPHIVIIDNVFPDKKTRREVPNRGLDFVVRHKQSYPDCLFLLYTGKGFQVDALGNKFPNPDILVTKTSLANVAYQQYIAKTILTRLNRYPVRAPTFLMRETPRMWRTFKMIYIRSLSNVYLWFRTVQEMTTFNTSVLNG